MIRADDQAELDAIKGELAADLEAVALAVLGEPNKALSSRTEWRWGSKGARSLQIHSAGGKRRGDWFDHEAGEGGGPLQMVHAARGQGWADTFKWARSWAGLDDTKPQDHPKPRQPDPAKVAAQEAEAAADRARRIAYARDLWGQRQPIAGTPAHAYLASRALNSPPGGWPDCIAFLPGIHHGLIVASTDDAGAVQAVQVVHLDEAGRKVKDRPDDWPEHWKWATKQTFGVPDGAAMRLPGGADPGRLLLAEGPETALSAWLCTGIETWATLGSTSKATLPANRMVVICRDDDKRFSPADRKTLATVTAWREAGHNVKVALPWLVRRQDKSDLNDVLQEAGPEGVAAAIRAAINGTSPDGRRRLPVAEARKQLGEAVVPFFSEALPDRLKSQGEEHANDDAAPLPVYGIRADVGSGKSRAVRKAAATMLAAMRAAGDDKGTVAFAVPTHKLGAEQAIEFESQPAARASGLTAGVWRGRTAPDPDEPGQLMCLNTDAVEDAHAAGLDAQNSVCKGHDEGGNPVTCPFFEVCAYQRQNQRRADAWFVAHELLFSVKPGAIGKVAALVVDEGVQAKGLEGVGEKPITLSLDSLDADAEVPGNSFASRRLRNLRSLLAGALADMPDGPILRDPIADTGLTAKSAAEARALEWRRHIDPKMHPGMKPAERRAVVKAAEGNKTIRRLARLWRAVEALLSPDGPEASGWARLALDRDDKGAVRVLRLKGRKPVRDGWVAPTLIIDANLDPALVRPYWPQVEMVADVAVETPHMRVRQVVNVSFSKSRLMAWDKAPKPKADAARKNLRNLHAAACAFARGHAPRPVLLVMQKEVEEAMPGCGPLPPNAIRAHHNAVAGLDQWTLPSGETVKGEDLAGLMVVGRTLPGPQDMERLAEALTGSASAPVSPWYPRVSVTREMADGQHIEAEAERHPDPITEAFRWQTCEGEIIQIIGRGRAVNRTADNPLDVLILTDVPVPVPVNQTLTLADLAPSPRNLMLAAGGIAYDNPTDAAKAYSGLWLTRERAKDAFKWAAEREVGGISVLDTDTNTGNPPTSLMSSTKLCRIDYQPAGMGKRRVTAWFDPATVPDPVAVLVAALGPLAWWEVEKAPEPPEPPGEAAEPPARPVSADAASLPDAPLSGLWTIRGRDWRVTIATDAGAEVSLWVPNGITVPESAMVPMLLPMVAGQKPPPLSEPPIGWPPPARNTLMRMMT